MIIVVKNGKVIGTHRDGQDLAGRYAGCEIGRWEGPLPRGANRNELPDDPRSDAQRAADRKVAAIARAESDYQSALAVGVQAVDMTIPADAESQLLFAHGLNVLATAELTSPDATALRAVPISLALGRTITDTAGVSHDPTVSEYRAMVLAYARSIAALQSIRNATIAQIESGQ